ncbi:RING finger protein 17-like [Pseudomyrmex gracilis]|uniref:RING finger protein 17-like n=1 Tax=Pseudomyrmex gracilis TaxID=219809 RepID=UPI00099512DD|nr:RING finger protein 17-like [Pseudomyrmex gracilis]
MWPNCVYVGALVAVQTTKGWQLGEITHVIHDDDVRIALRDWGTRITRKVRTVFRLPEQFTTENRTLEAISCSLTNILPFGGGQKWRSDDIHLVKFLSEDHRATIKIRGSTEDGVEAYVDLTVTREYGHSANLRKLLEDLGCGYFWPAVNTKARPGLQDIKY